MDMTDAIVIKQHLIDPEICIRCNTCEATCPVGAVTHDDRNYVVDPDKCNFCMACVPPCPTGSIDNWRLVARQVAISGTVRGPAATRYRGTPRLAFASCRSPCTAPTISDRQKCACETVSANRRTSLREASWARSI